MANKRTFKKALDYMGGDICENMMISYVNVEGADKKLISEAMGKVLEAIETARKNSNVKFDKSSKAFDNTRDYTKAKEAFFCKLFDKIYSDFNASVAEALKLYNSAIPGNVKEEMKAAVAE